MRTLLPQTQGEDPAVDPEASRRTSWVVLTAAAAAEVPPSLTETVPPSRPGSAGEPPPSPSGRRPRPGRPWPASSFEGRRPELKTACWRVRNAGNCRVLRKNFELKFLF